MTFVTVHNSLGFLGLTDLPALPHKSDLIGFEYSGMVTRELSTTSTGNNNHNFR